MKRLCVLLLLAPWGSSALDGGVRSLYQCPDAPVLERVDGGWFATDARIRRINCQLATCEDYASGLPEPQPTVSTLVVVGAVALGVGVAVGVGFAALRK